MACLAACWLGSQGCSPETPDLSQSRTEDRPPAIWPDYNGVTLPPNLGPINFTIREKGSRYFVRISRGDSSRCAITLLSRSPNVRIPLKPWRALLGEGPGGVLRIDVCSQDNQGCWTRFAPLSNTIAAEPIDTHLVYRIIQPLYMMHTDMGIYERDLTSFAERPLLLNTATGGNCINCHAFDHGNPDRMMFHMRAGAVGTSMILLYDGELAKVDTKTPANPAGAYRSWHPNGRIIAFSHNAVRQVFHGLGKNRDVYDRSSDLFLYDVKTHTITTSPKVASPDRMETYPEWSADGRFLYFCSAPALELYGQAEHPYNKIRYDLMRIAYDPNTGSWGEVERVVAASDQGLSAAHPRVSPDGRTLLFCMSKYSNFPLYSPDSDLYVLDLQTLQCRKAEEVNSDQAESYHSWSSNGRWIVFSSKRQDGTSTHFYISYFNTAGHFTKPFLLPQRDPEYQATLPIVYNIPEFVKGPVKVRPQALIKAAWSKTVIPSRLDPQIAPKPGPQVEEPLYTPAPVR
jgi:Tol biopolymer transport system component